MCYFDVLVENHIKTLHIFGANSLLELSSCPLDCDISNLFCDPNLRTYSSCTKKWIHDGTIKKKADTEGKAVGGRRRGGGGRQRRETTMCLFLGLKIYKVEPYPGKK